MAESGARDPGAEREPAWKKLLETYEDPGLDPAIDEELQAYMAKRRLDPVIEED